MLQTKKPGSDLQAIANNPGFCLCGTIAFHGGNNRKADVGKFETALATMIEQTMSRTAFGKITAVNVAIGIRSDGGKEVLDYSIAPTENGAAWSELLQGLRARGIKDIQLFIANGLVGLQSAIEAIRQAENLQDSKERLASFSAKWESGYKRRIKNLVQMEDLFTFFSFPTAIRQTIYSTNLIESFNNSLKKMVRRKEQFPTDTVT